MKINIPDTRAQARVEYALDNKNYAAAHRIVEKLDHPQRDEWLQEIEAMAQAAEVQRESRPPDPSTLAALSFVLTPIVSAVLLARNWRRMDRREWVRPTILGLLALIASCVLAVVLAIRVDTREIPPESWIEQALVIGIFGALFMYPFYLASLQRQSLLAAREGREEAATAQQRRLRNYSIYFVVAIIAMMGGGVGGQVAVERATSTTDTFRNETVFFHYPRGWLTESATDDPRCQDADEERECHIILKDASGEAEVLFYTLFTPENATSPRTQFTSLFERRESEGAIITQAGQVREMSSTERSVFYMGVY